jgi:hypothetical protein
MTLARALAPVCSLFACALPLAACHDSAGEAVRQGDGTSESGGPEDAAEADTAPGRDTTAPDLQPSPEDTVGDDGAEADGAGAGDAE